MSLSFELSKKEHERALQVLVGGVNSPVRSFSRVGGTPLLAKKAKRHQLWDVDDNVYVDFVLSYGPHLMGHAHPKIVEAVKKTSDAGFCFGMTSPDETRWAEIMCSRLPSLEKVRALSTGTEACMTAIRLARGYTGRSMILKCSGHYHGHVDSLMVDSGSGIATLSETPTADSAGIPDGVLNDTRVIEFNSLSALEQAFSEFGDKIAGFILEPVMGNMGVIPATKEYLQRARELCDQFGSVLIFDEVMTGFRVHEQSAQGLYDIRPDLSCFGKVVGGGLPLSALGGRADLMNSLAPLGKVYQAGTLSGNPLAIAAGIAMLELIEENPPYQRIETMGAKLEAAIQIAAKENKIEVCVQRVLSMFSVFFRKEKAMNASDARDVDYQLFEKYFWKMLEEGFILPPSPFEAYFLSDAHVSMIEDDFPAQMQRVFAALES